MASDHDWEQTGWEYDDSFFRCRRCHLATNSRRGYPPITVKDCMRSGIAPCRDDGATFKERTGREVYFINADLRDDESDTIAIGFFSTVEQALTAARQWVKEEREGGATSDICLWGWRGELNATKMDRLDLVNDAEAKMMSDAFRKIEMEFPPETEEQ